MTVDDTRRLVHLPLLGEAVEYLEGVAVFVWNEERRYVAVNDEACRLVGLDREELLRTPVGSLTENGAEPELAQVRDGGPVEGTSSFTRTDGQTVALAWTTARTRIAGLPYMVSVCRRVV